MDCFSCCFLYAGVAFAIYKLLDWLIRKPRVGNLGDRYILVTGCDTGFGNGIAKRLDSLGVNVFAGCLTETGETELRKACSPRLKTISLDVSKHESVTKAYEIISKAIPQGKGLWGVMNNAGISGKVGPAEFLSLDDYNYVFDINLLGLIDVTVTFLPLIKKANGRIVNTASVFGRHTISGSIPYCISKYGVESFSDSIRRQLKMFKTSVHLIEPGFHKTAIADSDSLARNLQNSFDGAPKEAQEEYGQEYVTDVTNKIIEQFVSGVISDRISDVVDAYEHALIGMFPRARYVVGTDAKFVWLPVQALPEWLGDWILMKLGGVPPMPRALRK